MTDSKSNSPTRGWLDKSQLSAVFDVAPTSFERTYRRHIPKAAEKKIDGKLYFHARSVLDEWAQSRNPKPGVEVDPLMLAEADSPALERYRAARADLAEMDVKARDKTIVVVAEIEPALMQLAGLIRRAGENLTRRFGNEAGAILNEAIDEFESRLPLLFPEPENNKPLRKD